MVRLFAGFSVTLVLALAGLAVGLLAILLAVSAIASLIGKATPLTAQVLFYLSSIKAFSRVVFSGMVSSTIFSSGLLLSAIGVS